MTKKPLPSYEMLCKLLRYEPETGKLFWRHRPVDMFANERDHRLWTGRFSGQEAFTANNGCGYKRSQIQGKWYLAHRIIWVLQTGREPIEEIDHINHDRSDNRWGNLRTATRSGNMSNVSSAKNSSSKYLGVSWHKATKKWYAHISKGSRKDGKLLSLGLYDCEEEAARAYDFMAPHIHGDFANLNFKEG